ncbi:hypothetical protein FRB96_005285 [Tulasnella sp. 330]|nr:hypothetical protein FRB96_005285 [Tulasnella sp. 330]
MQPRAFLRCRLTNTSSYVLLPGPTRVFMDGNFVCKSSLPVSWFNLCLTSPSSHCIQRLVGPGEKFSTSLGIDPALRVTYHPLVKKSKNVTGSKFLSLQTKTDVSSHIQRVSIKNTRLADVQLSLKITYPRVTTRTIK